MHKITCYTYFLHYVYQHRETKKKIFYEEGVVDWLYVSSLLF